VQFLDVMIERLAHPEGHELVTDRKHPRASRASSREHLLVLGEYGAQDELLRRPWEPF
jgi:hypothetical protein